MYDSNPAPIEITAIPSTKVTQLDVRPILKSGGEPFSVIMQAIGNTPADGALKLRATFKPTPLFHALGAKGWRHWIESGEGDDWTVWFYQGRSEEAAQNVLKSDLSLAHLQKDHPELQTRLKTEGSTWLLDVRHMSPPEPMELTLLVLEKLPKGATLTQINERVPQFLLPILEERGFAHEISDEKEIVRVKIARKN